MGSDIMNRHGLAFSNLLAVTLLSSLLYASMQVAKAAPLPDLQVKFRSPQVIAAGDPEESKFKVMVVNTGDSSAIGTESNNKKGYMIDLFLSQDQIPSKFARYSENYFDGVLLRGGRISNTKNLEAGQKQIYTTTAKIPNDTPAGKYRLCAKVDAGEFIVEKNEKNNLHCVSVQINQKLPTFKSIEKVEIITKSNEGIKRNVLSDGRLEIIYPDGTIKRLRPDGMIETQSPSGVIMVPKAMQTQGIEMPALPSELVGWGDKISESLLEVIRKMLTDAQFNAYLKTEEGKTFYEKLDWRIRSIGFLAIEQS